MREHATVFAKFSVSVGRMCRRPECERRTALLMLLTTLAIGDTYTVKSIGRRTDPYGTQQLQSDGAEDAEPTHTDCDRMARYELINDNALPPTPKLLFRRFRRMVWSIVSKAADISSATIRVASPRSAALYTTSIVHSRAVSVE